MELDDLKRNWNAFGETDPLWSILTWPGTRGNRWDLDEFWETGRKQVAEHLERADRLGLPVEHGRALDFGCGVGRLTQALAERFDAVVGVDIAASMVAQARAYNRHGDRVSYEVNERSDLSLFEDQSFDLVFTLIVLQHMEPRYSREYMREFCRLLRPGGLAIFQLPAEPKPREPLPPEGYQAELELLELQEEEGSVVMKVRATNAGTHDWPEGHGIFLGNHWRTPDGTMLVQDDGRTIVPLPLARGESVDLALSGKLPATAGDYVLEVDLVADMIGWFKDFDSPTLVVPVAYEPEETQATATSGEEMVPVMEVYGTPRLEVEDLVFASGCFLAHVEPDIRAGASWNSYTYYVLKPPPPAVPA